MKPIHTFTDRLRTAMDLRGTRAIDLARDTGLSKARISQYTNGIYVPKADALHKLARALDVADLWLEGYDVPWKEAHLQCPIIRISSLSNVAVFPCLARLPAARQYSPMNNTIALSCPAQTLTRTFACAPRETA